MSIPRTDDGREAEHCPRHRAGHPRGEPIPGSIWALLTMVSWAMAAATTLVSVAIFGAERNGLWLLAVIFYVGGIGTLLRGWGRMS